MVEEGYSIPQITKALRINRTYGYELIKEKAPKKRVQNDEASLRQKIQELCGMFPTNEYRRIRVWLQKKYGIHVNHKRVYRIMKELGLLKHNVGWSFGSHYHFVCLALCLLLLQENGNSRIGLQP
ncbi:IS3 family transposase [Thermoactinomyces sp. AMNI-1]|uniref:IS3 family transposase n=1 Tax=Thermoactinomyces mirandus TaxID=2756294 RepID=A0A7W1XV71_9BACL|nr:IS3 family transposase [Thermoactinomyces mirandus]